MGKQLSFCLLLFGVAMLVPAVPMLAAESAPADALAAMFGPAAAFDASADGAFCSARDPEDMRPYAGRGRPGPQNKGFVCAARCVDGTYVSCQVTSPYCSEYVVNANCPYQKGYCRDRFVGIKYCPTCNQCKAGEKCV